MDYRLPPWLKALPQLVDKEGRQFALRRKVIMGQINPYQGIVVPSPRSQKVTPQKDRPQREKRESAQEEPQAEEEAAKPEEDGESHLDLKA